MSDVKHWNQIYTSQLPKKVGWYKTHLNTTLGWIEDLNLESNEPIVDIGGGVSTLVDDLLEGGYEDLTVLDISKIAIQLTQDRLGDAVSKVNWLQGDVTEIELPSQHFRLWHDRAVFHFLIEQKLQQKYKETLLRALEIGGHFIIGAFALDAPPQCSGLPVQRYNSHRLTEIFGNEFELKRHQNEIHITPRGTEQSYVYCLFKRTA